MDQLNKLGDERRRGLLTLEALRSGGASISLLDAQIGQVEKVLQVISKSDDLRDQCIKEIYQSGRGSAEHEKKIDELQSVVAELEAKVMMQDAKLREVERKREVQVQVGNETPPTVTKAAGSGKETRSGTTGTDADVVDARILTISNSSANSGAALFAAALKGVEPSTTHRPRDAPKGWVRRRSKDDEFDQVVTPSSVSSKSVFRLDAPEFQPRQDVPQSKNVSAHNENCVKIAASYHEFEPLEPPKLFKPRLVPVPSEPTLKPTGTSSPPEVVKVPAGETLPDPVGPTGTNRNTVTTTEKPAETARRNSVMDDDEEVHQDEAIIRENFVMPMFEEPLGITAAVKYFINQVRPQVDTMDWAPFIKVFVQMGTENRARATKATEIYQAVTKAIGDTYLRAHLLKRCQKLFRKTLEAMESNSVKLDHLFGTLWFFARLFYWQGFGNRREVLGLAVCEALPMFAKKTVRAMSVEDCLTVIKELLEFMLPCLKDANADPKLEKELLKLSQAVLAQLGTFGPRMYKEQELARCILKHIDTLVKTTTTDDDSDDLWA